MNNQESNYDLKVGGLALILFVLGWTIAIKMKKGFWVGVGFSFLGSLAGYGIGQVVFTKPENK